MRSEDHEHEAQTDTKDQSSPIPTLIFRKAARILLNLVNELQKNTFQAQGDSIKAAGRAKAITAEAEAQARANELLSRSITNTLVQYEMAKRWNGQMPQVTGGAMPMLQLPGSKQPE